jgi:tetratricopeptide (TPR) repeat protein
MTARRRAVRRADPDPAVKGLKREIERATALPRPHDFAAWLPPFLLLAATLVAYFPAWHGGMLWDDDGHVTRAALRPLSGLWHIWFDVGATQQYYPVVHSAFWVLYGLWGGDTLGYHLVNILLHVLSAALIALILRRLAVPGAWLAATLFALHPIQVESVAWITELKNTLSGVFYLAAALAYLRFDDNRRRRFYVLALCLFALALLSKSVTATLPAALLVVFWWRRGTLDWRRDGSPLVPFFALGAGAGLLTVWVERTQIGAQGAEFDFSFVERCLIAGRAIWFYLVTLAWPAHLVFIYPRWQISQAAWWQDLYPLGALVLAAVLWALRKRTRAPLAALLFFAVTLFPALGFVNVFPFRYSFVADHFQYLAGIGVFAVASAAVVGLLARWTRQPGQATTVATVLVGVVLATLTWSQSRQYADGETLYRTTIARNPSCWLAYNNLGELKLHGGAEQLNEAVSLLTESLRLNARNAEAHNNLGFALQALGHADRAIAEYREAIGLASDSAEAYGNLGTALTATGHLEEGSAALMKALALRPDLADVHTGLGDALQEAGRLDAAARRYQEALQLDPNSARAHDGLGNTLMKMGRPADAATEFRAVLRAKGNLAVAHFNLANALQESGQTSDAVAEYQETLRLKPDFAAAHCNLGNVLLGMGQIAEAIAQYQEAIANDPASVEGHNNLGVALAHAGRTAEASLHFQEALRLNPGYAAAHGGLANLLLSMGRVADAIDQYRQAIAHDPGSAEVHNNLGVALERAGRHDEAVAAFREAVRIDPGFANARANLARAVSGGKQR